MSKPRRWLAAASSLALAVSLAACGDDGSGDSDPLLLTWSTTSSTSSNYAIAVEISQVMNEYVSDAQVTVTDSSGGPENVERTRNGQAQLSNMTSDQAFLAATGRGPYEGNGYDGIRTLLVHQDTVLYFVVRADSGVETVQDLAGEQFSAGFAGSSTNFVATEILRILGVDYEPYEADLGDAVNATKDDRIVGFVKSGISPDSNLLDLSTSTDIRIISFSPEDIATISGEMPFLPVIELPVPDDTYSGIPDGTVVSTVSLGSFVGMDESVSQEIGYQLVKALWEHEDQVAAIDFELPQLTIDRAAVPLHAGSVQYFKELGLDVPDDVIPPEYTE